MAYDGTILRDRLPFKKSWSFLASKAVQKGTARLTLPHEVKTCQNKMQCSLNRVVCSSLPPHHAWPVATFKQKQQCEVAEELCSCIVEETKHEDRMTTQGPYGGDLRRRDLRQTMPIGQGPINCIRP